MPSKKISAYIMAYNEEVKIAQAAGSVLWADEVVVIDSFSDDKTASIAEGLGARVVQARFEGFGRLRNQALDACNHEWIFSLDADERCTLAARDEILGIVASDGPADVYYVPRKNLFMGRHVKHSGFYPNYRQPQLFKKGALEYCEDKVHEGYEILSDKPPGYIKNPIWQIPFKDFGQIIHKADRYSTLGAEKLAERGEKSGMAKALGHGVWAFVQHYILKLGFMDGWAGFVIALGNFEGTFYRYAKLCERNAGWDIEQAQEMIADELP